MSDEEKKEYEELKSLLYTGTISQYGKRKLIDMFEKQSKEIEELKKENLEIRDWKYVIDSPIDLDKLKELDLIKIKGKEYVSKDKLKAKIEEIDEVLKGQLIEKIRVYFEAQKEVLQSLLEKE